MSNQNDNNICESPIVSIIIPAYNSEKFVYKAVKSALKQTLNNIEVIVVDDGSTDKTCKVLEVFRNDSRFGLYRQGNKGVSSARNLGLDICSGKYIMFLDSDDWLERNAAEILYKMAKKNESTLICSGGYSCDLLHGKIRRRRNVLPVEETRISSNYVMSKLNSDSYGIQSSCFKLYERKIIEDYHIRFNTEIHNCEDGLFVFEYLSYVQYYMYLRMPLWNIFHHRGSVTRSEYNSKMLSGVYASDEMLKFCKDNDMREKVLAHKASIAKEIIKPAIMSKKNVSQDIVFLKTIMYDNRSYYFKYLGLRGKMAYVVFYYVPVPLLKRIMPVYYKYY